MLTKILFAGLLLLSVESAFAYQCSVACEARYRENLGWFTGTGGNCSEADSKALAQCRAVDPNFYPMEGGCTQSSNQAVYTRRCESNYVIKSSWQTVYGDSKKDIDFKAQRICDSFCDNYKYYNGGPSACTQSANACIP